MGIDPPCLLSLVFYHDKKAIPGLGDWNSKLCHPGVTSLQSVSLPRADPGPILEARFQRTQAELLRSPWVIAALIPAGELELWAELIGGCSWGLGTSGHRGGVW